MDNGLSISITAEVALNIAIDLGIFNEWLPATQSWQDLASPATLDQILQFQALKKLVQEMTKDKVWMTGGQSYTLHQQ